MTAIFAWAAGLFFKSIFFSHGNTRKYTDKTLKSFLATKPTKNTNNTPVAHALCFGFLFVFFVDFVAKRSLLLSLFPCASVANQKKPAKPRRANPSHTTCNLQSAPAYSPWCSCSSWCFFSCSRACFCCSGVSKANALCLSSIFNTVRSANCLAC